MTTSTTDSFVPNLKGDARLDWHKFNDNLLTIARQTVRAQTGGTGLLGYLLPNAMWITFPANIRADGTIIPVFDVITPIEVPPNNANNKQVIHPKPTYQMTENLRFEITTRVRGDPYAV